MKNIEKGINSNEFEHYREAIDKLGSEKNIVCTKEMLEGVLSVFVYHKIKRHLAVIENSDGLSNELTPVFYLNLSNDMDWFTKGQLKGLIKFLRSFEEGQDTLDLSDFFLASGFEYQIATNACKEYLKYVENDEYNHLFQKLTFLIPVFDSLWKLKMDSRRILGNIINWNDDLIKIVNDFLKDNQETEFDVLVGLSMNDEQAEKRKIIIKKVVLPHLDNLKKRRDKLNKTKRNTNDLDLQKDLENKVRAIGDFIKDIKDWYPEIKKI